MGSLGLWWLHALATGPGAGGDATGDGEWSTGAGFGSAEDQAGELGGLGLALEAGWGWEPQQMRLCHLPARHQAIGEHEEEVPSLKSCGHTDAMGRPPDACPVPSR